MRARSEALAWMLSAALIAGSPAQIAAQDQGWVEAFSALRMRPGFADRRSSLAERLALARALGRYGPEREAVATLLAGLKGDPPIALRDELLLALARRAAPDASATLRELLAGLKGENAGAASLALALGASDDASTIDALVRALPHPPSARVADEALQRIGAAAVPRLAAALASPQLALPAARVLTALGPRALGARAALDRALRSDSAALRAAAARALGLSDAVASAGALAALLDDDAEVARAALDALARVGTADQAQALAKLWASSEGERRVLALRALATASPAQAVPALQRALRKGDAGERAAALDVLEGDSPDASWSELLAALVREQHSEAAASALARIADGEGMPALLRAARARAAKTGADARANVRKVEPSTATDAAARALAIGLRRFGEALDDDVRGDALAVLRALPAGERRLVLRALARDSEVRDELATALRARDAKLRASAAIGARMLGDDTLGGAVRAALLRERDVEAVRRLCDAARVLGARFSWQELQRWLGQPETAPEAAALAAASLSEPPPVELRSALRRMLSPGRTGRLRAAAALALAALRDAAAWPALAATLDDPAARVRLAAVHALARLPVAEARQALRSHARIERDARVRDAALAALGDSGPATDPRGAAPRVLEARVRTDAGPASEPPLLDVLLDDGRWLRMRTLPGGELVLEDLAPGQADVRAVP